MHSLINYADKSVLYWNATKEHVDNWAQPRRALKGHGHFVQDVAMSSDGQFALSGSWGMYNTSFFVHSLTFDIKIALSVCGMSTLDKPLAASTDTPRMFCLLLSLLTTVKSSLVLEIRPSSCGTPSESASTPSSKTDTLSGSAACASPPTPNSPSSFHAVGTNWSRSGVSLTAS